MSSLHSKVSSTEHPPAFPSFLKHTTEFLSPQAPASPSSLPSLPPTRPLPFWAPLRPVRSLNEPPVPLPPTLSSSFPTFPTRLPSAPSSYTFLPSLQGLPAPTPNAAPHSTLPAHAPKSPPKPPSWPSNFPPIVHPAPKLQSVSFVFSFHSLLLPLLFPRFSIVLFCFDSIFASFYPPFHSPQMHVRGSPNCHLVQEPQNRPRRPP